MKPNFSIVLIAKNESKTLPKMLRSLKSYRDRGGEIIIVDTGSNDDTVKIARDFGCIVDEVEDRFKIYLSKEQVNNINNKFSINEGNIVNYGDSLFDFSSARNYAASLASNDMISNQDCDEEYTELCIDDICMYIDQGYDQFEYNFVFSHNQYGGEEVKFIQSKFYNRTKLEWRGIVHEVLQNINNNNIKKLFLSEDIIKLEHWQNPETPRGNYLKGLALDCYLHPFNDRNSHYLARELFNYNKFHSAIREFERHISMNKWKTEAAQSMIYIGDCHGKLKNKEKQVEFYEKSFKHDSSRREALLKLANFYRNENDPQKVACYAAAAMEIAWTGLYMDKREQYENEPHELMYWAKGWMGNIKGAQEHIIKALEFQPYNKTYLEHTKYYFEYPDNGIEGWMRFPELQWLYNTAKTMNTICEVGSWKGKSTHALASGCKNGKITAIDHFLGSNETAHKGASDNDNIYKSFIDNMKAFNNIIINRKSSIEASNDYMDKEFDMVFIDAGHTYEDVKSDIKAWRNKAKILLCGHDYSDVWPGVKKAVQEEIGEVNVCDSIWYKYL